MAKAAAAGRLQTVNDFFKYGINCSGDYSGFDGPREMMTQVYRAFQHRQSSSMCLKDAVFRFTRSCDNAVLPQSALIWIAEELDNSESCVLKDVMASLTRDAQDHIENMVPHRQKTFAAMSKEEKNEVSESYKNVQQWLVDHRGTAFGFGDCIRSPCLIHDEDCLVQVAVKEEDDSSCLRLSWDGTTCIGWFSVGEGARYSHQSEMVHATWMAQRIRLSELALEDGFFQECTRMYPAAVKLEEPLRAWFRVVFIKTCPTTLGFPSKRVRSLSFSMANNSLQWIGPETQEEIQADFDATFAREMVLDGDVFLAAPKASVVAVYKELMEKRKVFVADDSEFTVTGRSILSSFLPPGHLSRINEYEALYRKKHGFAPSSFIMDLETNPQTPGDSSGSSFPSQLTHGQYFSFGRRRLVLSTEHLFANGWNARVDVDSRYKSPLSPFFANFRAPSETPQWKWDESTNFGCVVSVLLDECCQERKCEAHGGAQALA